MLGAAPNKLGFWGFSGEKSHTSELEKHDQKHVNNWFNTTLKPLNVHSVSLSRPNSDGSMLSQATAMAQSVPW